MEIDDAHLTVLLPVRNGGDVLPAWLESVEKYADAVIALDDGSTDDTRQLLDAHPVVTDVLANPVRPTYHGWDDLGNRQRLVYAALARGARWLLFLDADEQLDHADGQALREFLESDARPGYAYGLQVFRMVGDDQHYDPHALWVFRLFSADDATTPLGTKRLHFVPVPKGIPRTRWLNTSLRIQHAGSLTPEHRAARFEKYRQADPGNEFQNDYGNLLREPLVVRPWPVRAPELQVLLGTDGRYADGGTDEDPDAPALSAVVIARDDEDVIEGAVRALVDQEVDEPFEVIVVCSGTDGTYRLVREAFPQVRAVQLPVRALPGEARNAGLWMAGGEYVSFPGSHVRLLPGSLQARLRAHDDGWDLVAGAVVNGNDTPAGWASYFLDHTTKTPSRPAGEWKGVPGSASYVRRDVRAVGGFPEDVRTAEDTVVNKQLYAQGKRTGFCPAATFVHASPSTTTAQLLHHHFQRGRGLGRMIRTKLDGPDLARLRTSLDLPKRRLRTVGSGLAEADGSLRDRYRGRVRALVTAGAVAAGVGTWFQLVAARPSPAGAMTPPTGSAATNRGHGPWLVLSGRPGEAARGILACGKATQAGQRLATFTRYARSVGDVRPALAPIVTSAMVTEEQTGTFTVDLPWATVDAHLRAARRVGATLLLQLQPGGARLDDVIARWERLIAYEDVGVYLDLRDDVAFAGQRTTLADAVDLVRWLGGDDTPVLVRGAPTDGIAALAVAEPLDLRRRGTPFPHEALAAGRPTALIYE